MPQEGEGGAAFRLRRVALVAVIAGRWLDDSDLEGEFRIGAGEGLDSEIPGPRGAKVGGARRGAAEAEAMRYLGRDTGNRLGRAIKGIKLGEPLHDAAAQAMTILNVGGEGGARLRL